MGTSIKNYNKVFDNLKKAGYDVRNFYSCLVVANGNGSIVLYQKGDHKSTWIICKGDDVITCDGCENVVDEVAKLM